MTHDRKAITTWISTHPRGVTRAQAMSYLGISANAFQQLATRMKAAGLIVRVGGSIHTRWATPERAEGAWLALEAEYKMIHERQLAKKRELRLRVYGLAHPDVKRRGPNMASRGKLRRKRKRIENPPAPVHTLVNAADVPAPRTQAPRSIFELAETLEKS